MLNIAEPNDTQFTPVWSNKICFCQTFLASDGWASSTMSLPCQSLSFSFQSFCTATQYLMRMITPR